MLDNLIEMMMNCWGVVWQYEGVFIQLGGIWTRSQETSVFVTWTGAYCDIFCNKFHGACNLKYILCWNWIGKKKNKKKLKWKKKIKKKYLKWLRVVFLFWNSYSFQANDLATLERNCRRLLFLWNQHETNILIYTWWNQDLSSNKKQIPAL